jgi:ribonuclease HII
MMAVVSRLSKTQALFTFDALQLHQAHISQRVEWLIGVDEVGRGSLIGPVVAAAVCFGPFTPTTNDDWAALGTELAGLNDSKQVQPAERQRLVPLVKAHSQWSIAQASQKEVETLNVSQASLLAATRAIDEVLATDPTIDPARTLVLLDGKTRLPHCPVAHQQALVKGDGLSAHIAAASVLAKQWRDQWVIQQHLLHPGYGWERNMGYATAAHRAAIARQGRCALHRSTFTHS